MSMNQGNLRVLDRSGNVIQYDLVHGWFGRKVSKATATLPQTGDASLFTITEGRILLMGLIGEVTTVIETQNNATLIKFNPADSVTDTDLCAALEITGDIVGTMYTISGIVGDALRAGLFMGLGGLFSNPQILSEGIVELECAAGNTGSVKWDLYYVALDDNALVVAN